MFFLTGQEGKLFGPLAFTKTFVMLASACMAVTLVPVLMTLIMRTRMLPEDTNPLNRLLNMLYQPFSALGDAAALADHRPGAGRPGGHVAGLPLAGP